MNAVIKSADVAAANVLPLNLAQRPPARPPELASAPVELAVLRHEVEALNRSLTEREADLDRLRGDVRRAYREGETEGRKAGLQAAETQRTDELKALQAGVAQACDDFDVSLRSLERLAVVVARESLAQVLADPEAQSGLAAQVIRRQIAQIEGESIVRVEVSAETFADDQQLRDLAQALGRPSLEILALNELGVGQCRIKLALGAIEVGVGQQWGRLSDLLTTLAQGEGARV